MREREREREREFACVCEINSRPTRTGGILLLCDKKVNENLLARSVGF